MLKKIMSFPKFAKCEATKRDKLKSLIIYMAFAGTKNIVVGNDAFKITKIKE
jgi:hypothetical protein